MANLVASKQLPVRASCCIVMGMSVSRLNESTLRPPEHLLVWAFIASLAAHLVVYGGFRLGHQFGWWNRDLLPAWLKPHHQTLAEIKKAQTLQPPPQQQEVPLVFV